MIIKKFIFKNPNNQKNALLLALSLILIGIGSAISLFFNVVFFSQSIKATGKLISWREEFGSTRSVFHYGTIIHFFADAQHKFYPNIEFKTQAGAIITKEIKKQYNVSLTQTRENLPLKPGDSIEIYYNYNSPNDARILEKYWWVSKLLLAIILISSGEFFRRKFI